MKDEQEQLKKQIEKELSNLRNISQSETDKKTQLERHIERLENKYKEQEEESLKKKETEKESGKMVDLQSKMTELEQKLENLKREKKLTKKGEVVDSDLMSTESNGELLLRAIRSADNAFYDLLYTEGIDKETLLDNKRNPAVYLSLICVKQSQSLEEQNKRKKIVKKLLNEEFPVNIPNRSGNLPLHKVVKKNLLEIVEDNRLMKNVDINAKNKKGETPLILAVNVDKGGNMSEMIFKLLNLGADPNAKNDNDETPLYFSVINKKIKIFKSLISSPKIDFFIKIKSNMHGAEIDILGVLMKMKKDNSTAANDMWDLAQNIMINRNSKVLHINNLPIKIGPEHSINITNICDEKKKIFVSYAWKDGPYCTVPMVDNFCKYMDDNNIYYFRDCHPSRGVDTIGNKNLEVFMEYASKNSNLTVAFINEQYFVSRNCLFELSQFWDKSTQKFKPNIYFIIHPDFNEVYRNNDSKFRLNLKKYIDEWKGKIEKYEAQYMDILSFKSKISEEEKSLSEVTTNMIQYLSDYNYTSYEELRVSGYYEIFKNLFMI